MNGFLPFQRDLVQQYKRGQLVAGDQELLVFGGSDVDNRLHNRLG